MIFTGEHTGLAFSQTELCFQIFRQEHHKSGNYDQFHAGSQAGYYVNWIAGQSPHRLRYIFGKISHNSQFYLDLLINIKHLLKSICVNTDTPV